MPYGGKYQLTEVQTMVAKLPVLKGKTDMVTMMSYGYDPYLSSWSAYHGAIYAVIESMSKIVATGGDYSKIRFTYQEYFRRMTEDASRWGEPMKALLGSFEAQMGFSLPSIGGKDSMSGTFNDIDVPNTLVSFAVNTASSKDIITPEFKKAGSKLVLFEIAKDEYDVPVYAKVMDMYKAVSKAIADKAIISAYTLDAKGIVPAVSKMAFGNMMGATIDSSVAADELFAPKYGCILAEVAEDKLSALTGDYVVIGEVTDNGKFTYGDVVIEVAEALNTWKKPLEKVFPTVAVKGGEKLDTPIYKASEVYVCKNKIAKPTEPNAPINVWMIYSLIRHLQTEPERRQSR
jgi:phosphoribosylformylglycinamidine synthase